MEMRSSPDINPRISQIRRRQPVVGRPRSGVRQRDHSDLFDGRTSGSATAQLTLTEHQVQHRSGFDCRIGFGKHRGRPLFELGGPYLVRDAATYPERSGLLERLQPQFVLHYQELS